MATSAYRGRFAPSPTGPLHFGSLVAALASCVDARAQAGEWLVRIDDLDQGRCISGMDSRILATLEAFGFEWDGTVSYQTDHLDAYHEALDLLQQSGHVYYCRCSRSQVAQAAQRSGLEGPVYPGTCRSLSLGDAPGRAARLRTDNAGIAFVDRLFGPQAQVLARDIGDFVIRRADGFFAYQLAVVIDDELTGVNQVVRGADLLPSTPRQVWLSRLLGHPTPDYLHVPLVFGSDGRKLSKSDRAHPVDADDPIPALLAAWRFLGQAQPQAAKLSLSEFWHWAPTVWEPALMRTEPAHD